MYMPKILKEDFGRKKWRRRGREVTCLIGGSGGFLPTSVFLWQGLMPPGKLKGRKGKRKRKKKREKEKENQKERTKRKKERQKRERKEISGFKPSEYNLHFHKTYMLKFEKLLSTA